MLLERDVLGAFFLLYGILFCNLEYLQFVVSLQKNLLHTSLCEFLQRKH